MPDQSTPVMVRLSPEQLRTLDSWRRDQKDLPGRPEALRRLMESALADSAPRGARDKGSTAKASAMARQELERLTKHATGPADEQESRKRRLLKGPKEFRDMLAGGQQRAKRK